MAGAYASLSSGALIRTPEEALKLRAVEREGHPELIGIRRHDGLNTYIYIYTYLYLYTYIYI